jgi:hypothetical protein
MRYKKIIENAILINDIESNTTTGDLEYPGTALEICNKEGEDLFHFIVDGNGDIQALFFANKYDYRIPVELLEKIVAKSEGGC